MTPINSHAESANFFRMLARLREAEGEEVDEILDTLATMRERSPCAAIRLRCAFKLLKYRGMRARVANGTLAAALATLAGFICQAAALDGVVNCLDRLA